VDYKWAAKRSKHFNTGFYLLSDHESGAVWAYPNKTKDEE
jgi:hypothetical protein